MRNEWCASRVSKRLQSGPAYFSFSEKMKAGKLAVRYLQSARRAPLSIPHSSFLILPFIIPLPSSPVTPYWCWMPRSRRMSARVSRASVLMRQMRSAVM